MINICLRLLNEFSRSKWKCLICGSYDGNYDIYNNTTETLLPVVYLEKKQSDLLTGTTFLKC